VTVKLSGRRFTTPIYFLATGAVTIDGGIDLTGENGSPATNIASERVPSAPGPGGYPGGVGGNGTAGTTATAGSGPGGGAAGNPSGSSGATGTFTGSTYLIPLLGGSGGGGYGANPLGACGKNYGGGGGAGGGAIVIASSVSITFTNTVGTDGIFANAGGAACGAGGGSGGAIRLVAPIISGRTELQTNQTGTGGITRLESVQNSFACCVRGTLLTSLPFNVITPVTQGAPGLQVTSINGVSINANPFSFPDTTINTASAVTVNVSAQYIPVGTVPQILIYSEFGPDQTVPCSALQGTLQQSTCSASIQFPTGGSRGFVKATW
jgi:hypothetical protein